MTTQALSASQLSYLSNNWEVPTDQFTIAFKTTQAAKDMGSFYDDGLKGHCTEIVVDQTNKEFLQVSDGETVKYLAPGGIEYTEITDVKGKYLTHLNDPARHYHYHRKIEIIDPATGLKYGDDPKWVIRVKCALLFFFSTLLCVVVPLCHLFYDLWQYAKADSKGREKIKNELKKDCGELISIIPRLIFGQIAFTLIALYGIISPYEGRALYADVEKLFHGYSVTAPCFEPNPTRHLLGGITVLKL